MRFALQQWTANLDFPFHSSGLTSDNTVASLDTEGHPECAFQVDSTAAPGAPLGTGKGDGIWTKRVFLPTV